MCNQQAKQKATHDRKALSRDFIIGDRVMVKNLRAGPTYVQGTVIQKLAPLSFLVEVQNHLKLIGDSTYMNAKLPADNSFVRDEDVEADICYPTRDEITPHTTTHANSQARPQLQRTYPAKDRHNPSHYFVFKWEEV